MYLEQPTGVHFGIFYRKSYVLNPDLVKNVAKYLNCLIFGPQRLNQIELLDFCRPSGCFAFVTACFDRKTYDLSSHRLRQCLYQDNFDVSLHRAFCTTETSLLLDHVLQLENSLIRGLDRFEWAFVAAKINEFKWQASDVESVLC